VAPAFGTGSPVPGTPQRGGGRAREKRAFPDDPRSAGGLSDVTDFFLIATGDSDTHARAISENILDRTREDGFRPVGVEGLNQGRWVLMDYVGLIVHVFLDDVREFYRLERLWGDAPLFELE